MACTKSTDSGHIKSINFVASSVFHMLTDTWNCTPYTPVLFQGVREPSGSFMFMALNDTTSASGILGGIVNNKGVLSIDDCQSLGDFLLMDPVSGQASHYPTTLLLSALPYNVRDVNGCALSVNIVNSTSIDGTVHYGGLATGIGCPVTETHPLLMIPASYFIHGNCSDKTIVGMDATGIFASIYQNQCIMSPNTSYSQSQFCQPNVTGFTKKYECQQGGTLYAYCNNSAEVDGSRSVLGCGTPSTYTNMLTGNQEFAMSCKGWCNEGFCVSSGSDNVCKSHVGNDDTVPWWVWIIIVILILIILAMFVFILIEEWNHHKTSKTKIIIRK